MKDDVFRGSREGFWAYCFFEECEMRQIEHWRDVPKVILYSDDGVEAFAEHWTQKGINAFGVRVDESYDVRGSTE